MFAQHVHPSVLVVRWPVSSISAPTRWRFAAEVDYVPAPAAWELSDSDAQALAHFNLKVTPVPLRLE